MKELDYLIYEKFRIFGISARHFNSMPENEQLAYANTLRFMVKEELTRRGSFESEKLNRALRKIDRRVEDIMFA